MLKKLLCVMISALMVISVLPVGVFAADTVEIDGTTYDVIFSEDVGVASGNWNSFTLSSSSSFLTALQTSGAYLVITRDSSASGASYDNLKFGDTWYSGTSATMDLSSPDIGSGTVVGFLASDVYTEWVDGGNSNGGDPMFISNTADSYTITNIFVVTVSSSSASTTTSTTEDVLATQETSNCTLTILSGSDADFTDEELYLYINYTLSDDSYAGWAPAALDDSSWAANLVEVTVDTTGVFKVKLVDIASAFEADGYDVSNGVVLNWWGSYATFVSAQLVRVSTEVPTTSTRNQGVIYINEDYHGIFVTRTIGTSTRKYLVNVPHTVDSTGYCTVCKMYVGGEEAGTATVDGVEYEVAYSADVNLASSGWGTYEFADNSIIDALANDGALLVITRSEATDVVYDSDAGTYEKLGLVDSWWVGDWIRLGTDGHTDADEVDDTIIDCISDDGTTIIYDGATVYAAWESAGMNNGGVATLITNTSGSYTITNVAVYVPVGTVVTEEVNVDEPAEDTNTETEDDELDVDDTDAEEVTETNPTTGAVLALVPMAIAGFAVVASKRR